MTTVTLAAIVLAAGLNAGPEKAATPAKPAAPAAPGAAKVAKPAKPAKASKEAIKDARAALLGPCAPEMATARLKSVAVIGGDAMNAVAAREKLAATPAVPDALFLAIEYETPTGTEKDYRQVNSLHHLTTDQAQILVGEKLCVFGRAP